MKKALFIRLDRIGDLVLTLPCERLINENYDVHWVTPKGLEFVVDACEEKKQFTSIKKDFSWSNFFYFLKIVRKLRPDVSLSFHVPWWINAGLWLARVPIRGGVLSQWHSYLFLNNGLRQKRSQCDFHEMEYNFILVEETFKISRNRERWIPEKLVAPSSVDSTSLEIPKPYVVIHVGMGGSALNWPTDHYHSLIAEMSQTCPVVMTGTQADIQYLAPLKSSLKDCSQVVWLDRQLNGSQLLYILDNASAIVAPSTGVLHLAAALGAASFGIYSPIKVHHPNRWGPKGSNTHVFLPPNKCPSSNACLGKSCDSFNCMESILPKTVLEGVQAQLV